MFTWGALQQGITFRLQVSGAQPVAVRTGSAGVQCIWALVPSNMVPPVYAIGADAQSGMSVTDSWVQNRPRPIIPNVVPRCTRVPRIPQQAYVASRHARTRLSSSVRGVGCSGSQTDICRV